MRPERQFKPGMDGGLRAAVLVSPPHYLRTTEFLSKRWGPPHVYAPAFPDVNPEPHPATKTITVHQDYFGGVYQDRTYRWNGAKIELVEENGNTNGSEDPDCGFTSYCSRLINGEMVITAEKPSGC